MTIETFCTIFLGSLLGNIIGDFLWKKFGGED